jgi:hypothetical protein
MSLVKFELTEDHINLLRNMEWNQGEMDPVVGEFNGDYDEEEMGIIIYGKPEGDFDPLDEEVIPYTEEQIEHLNKLKEGLPMALDIIMQTGKFEAGHYKRKFHLRDWKKYEPKDKK